MCWAKSTKQTGINYGALTFVVFTQCVVLKYQISEPHPLSESCSPQFKKDFFFYHNPSTPPILWSFEVDFCENVDWTSLYQTQLLTSVWCLILKHGNQWQAVLCGIAPSPHTAQISRPVSAIFTPWSNAKSKWCQNAHSILMIWKYTKINEI